MAVAAADLLTDQHRRAQLALRAATLRDLLRLWPVFDVNNIAGTWPPLEAGLVALIQARAPLSAALAADYFSALRTAAAVPGRPEPRLAAVPPPEDIIPGLRVVGPVNAGQRLARGARPEQVADATLVNVSGETGRQVLNVGRATIVASAAADRHPPRIRRVTDRDPCTWCSNEAASTYPAGSRFPAHSHCACFPAPVY